MRGGVLVFCVLSLFLMESCTGKKFNRNEDELIEVFVIPHSHCDAGWLQTLDSYFELNVSLILDQVTTALVGDPGKRFCWSEIVYFSMWWEEQSPEWQLQVKELVSSGRLEFVGGGWVQSDEAVTHYASVIDQLTEGHQFLLDTFGIQPLVGWQIDPFGPSTITPTIHSLAGFPYHVINRVDDRLKHVFNSSPSIFDSGIFTTNRTFEFNWQASKNYMEQTQIFTHVLDDHYSPPQYCWPNATNPTQLICLGYDFESSPSTNPPVNSSNIYERASMLASVFQTRATYFRHNKILAPFGNDFRYQNASLEFDNIGKLIDYINANSSFGMRLQYATPIDYFNAVANSTQPSLFPLVQNHDYFPYTMCLGVDYSSYNTCANYWTGFYTSYPVLKEFVRSRDALLRIGELLYVLAKASSSNPWYSLMPWDALFSDIEVLRQASGVLNHHDAVTGTARTLVREDHFNMLYAGTNATNKAIESTLGMLMGNKYLPDLTTDPTFLASVVPGQTVPVAFYNSLAWDRAETAKIPIPFQDVRVYTSSGIPIKYQVVQNFDCIVQRSSATGCGFVLYFQVSIPALGFSTYLSIDDSFSKADLTQKHISWQRMIDESALSLENEFYRVDFEYDDDSLYHPYQIVNKIDNVAIALQHQILVYSGLADDPYKFRPIGVPQAYNITSPEVYYSPGPLVQQLALVYSQNLTVIYRIFTEILDGNSSTWGNFIEVEHWIALANNTEVVSRFTTANISTLGTFYTDNGLEMQERNYQMRYNDSFPWSMISGNFYPVISTAYITDGDLQFTILTNQSMGGSSQINNTLGVMLHRRTYAVQWSLDESQNDTSTAHVTLRLIAGKRAPSERNRIPISYSHQNPLLPVYGTPTNNFDFGNWTTLYTPSFAPLNYELPQNLHLLSLKSLGGDTPYSILRFVHLYLSIPKPIPQVSLISLLIYEKGQDPLYSQNATVNIQTLFKSCNITDLYETTITANKPLQKQKQAPMEFSFNPIQIRTFVSSVN